MSEDGYPERDPDVVRRELRIHRAVVALVVHGFHQDETGVAFSIGRLRAESAELDDMTVPLTWALARLPRTTAVAEDLLDYLAALSGIPDRPEP